MSTGAERNAVPTESELVYDWNTVDKGARPARVEFNDETLRDGIQSPSARDPSIDDKLRILHLISDLGIEGVDLGLPGSSQRQRDDVKRMAQEIEREKLRILPNCAARTVVADIKPICDVADDVGTVIEVACFMGSSPIRQYAEDWDLDRMLLLTEEAVGYAVGRGLPVMYVTEDTTRATPETIRCLYTTAIEAGARRICVCDTVGHVTPDGVHALIGFVNEVVEDTGEEVAIDWHGHRDRSLDVSNTLAALQAGASRVHGTAIGIGERSGNTPMEALLVNCKLLGWIDNDLSKLREYCEVASESIGVPIPPNYPIVGEDAFRTATGVHAAAVIKAQKKGHEWLADRVYSGVPAAMIGRQQEIEIGPMSGASNVEFWLRERGIEPDPGKVAAVLAAAKAADHVLTEDEVRAILDGAD